MGYLEFEPWFLPRFPADFFLPRGFFPAGFFWPPSDSSSCVNCRSALSLVLRLILRSCNRKWYNVLLLLLVLGLNCQNKPNGFVFHHVVCCVMELKLLVAPTCNILFPHFTQKKYDFKSIQSHFLQEAAITKHARRIAEVYY